MEKETSKCLIYSLIWLDHGTEKVPYSLVKKNKFDDYCILTLFSMYFNLSLPLITGMWEDIFSTTKLESVDHTQII